MAIGDDGQHLGDVLAHVLGDTNDVFVIVTAHHRGLVVSIVCCLTAAGSERKKKLILKSAIQNLVQVERTNCFEHTDKPVT